MSKINENGVIRDMTAEEEAQLVKDNEESLAMKTAFETAKTAKENLYDKRPFLGLPAWYKGFKIPK